MKKKYVLKNRIRFGIFVSILVFLNIVLFWNTSTYGYKEIGYTTLEILPGDTLWEIALKNAPGGDIRKYIYELKKINGLEDSIIYPGMSIKLP